MSNKKTRSWCFTINNYKTHIGVLDDGHAYIKYLCDKLVSVRYMIIGLEVGKENGVEHIQGYLDFDNPRTLGGITKVIKFAHWEARKGTLDQAIEYCKKDGNFYEFGDKPSQGKRSDLVIIKESIENGKRVDEIVMDDPICYHQYGRTLNKIEDLCMRKKWRKEMTTCVWYWGPTGVGKSHIAYENFNTDTHYVVPNDNGWWDGYTQQDIVIFNDFRGEVPYNEMLQIIDKWPYSVRRRNREPMPFISKHVIITCSMSPADVYHNRNTRDHIGQLLRRIVVIKLDEFYRGSQDAQGSEDAQGSKDRNSGTELKWSEGNTENINVSPPTFEALLHL